MRIEARFSAVIAVLRCFSREMCASGAPSRWETEFLLNVLTRKAGSLKVFAFGAII
jgi:hypothetical protein